MIVPLLQKEISKEIGVDDTDLAEFVLDIHSKCKNGDDFQQKLDEMDAGLSDAFIKKLDLLIRMKGPRNQRTVHDSIVKTEVKVEEGLNEVSDSKLDALSLPDSKNALEFTDTGNNSLSLPDRKWEPPTEPSRKRMRNNDERPQLDKIYQGRVVNLAKFGAFVRLYGVDGRVDGLVHVSEIADSRVDDVSSYLKVNQDVYVKVIRLERSRISLSLKQVDQMTGEERQPRGRREVRDTQTKRRLTSPERWEIRQLIASGVASIHDYPELEEDANAAFQVEKQDENPDEGVDIELKEEEAPFLAGQTSKEIKMEAPMVVKMPKGSMNRAANQGSDLLKQHREEKAAAKKELTEKLRKERNMGDPSAVKQAEMNALTSWEKNKIAKPVSFGKRTNLSMKEQRETLPVFQMRQQLVDAVRDNQFLVIVGETGSGKTTQLTQYLYEEGFSSLGMIGCTQPRRVAAISVAKRVSEEVGCVLGNEVGYNVRFDDKTSNRTCIKYMTDGMLQREALIDPLMSKYSVILLDEAHERTIATDVLFALLKNAAAKREDLKVIVTSATLDSGKFSSFFNDCPIMKIPGRTFPVEVMYAQQPQMDYLEAALETVMEIHINEPEGDILVFLTGQEEIDTSCEVLFEKVKLLGDSIPDLIILPVYSALPAEVQTKIFEPTPPNSRKVIFATNIAETSITIDGIYYVIDPGFSKVSVWDPKLGMEQLVVLPISQAQANQRKGRAGRTGPGKCFRLYTEQAFNLEMLPNTVPEIQRQNLSMTILMLKAMGINDLLNFEFMDPPPRSSMVNAMEQLYHLQALDDDGYLTPLGRRMSMFPMEPTLAKTLIASVDLMCSDEILTILSMLSVQNVFHRPKDKQQEADNKKSRFNHPYGDHLTLLNVYQGWEDNNFSRTWCSDHYVQERHMKKARDVKRQLVQIFKKLQLPLTSCGPDVDRIRKALVSGLFKHASKRDNSAYKTLYEGTSVNVHPSSALFGKEYEYVVYHTLVLTTREYMQTVTVIEPKWLAEVAPHFYKVADNESETKKSAKIVPLHNKFTKDQDAWRLTSIQTMKAKALGNQQSG